MKRVIIGSFAAALLLGSLYLGVSSISNMRVKCEDGGHAECAFTEQVAHEIGRMQALAATGCALVGAGTLLFLRSKAKEKENPT
jgi:hypothetical protein